MRSCFQKLFTYDSNRVCSKHTQKHKEPAGRGPPCSLILLVVQWRAHPHLKGNERKDGAEEKVSSAPGSTPCFSHVLAYTWNETVWLCLCSCAAMCGCKLMHVWRHSTRVTVWSKHVLISQHDDSWWRGTLQIGVCLLRNMICIQK